MKSVFEIVYRYIEPSFKRMLVKKLYENGIPGIEIARILGVSPSLVTRYVNGERGAVVNLEDLPEARRLVDTIASKVISGRVSEYEVSLEIYAAIAVLLSKKQLCKIHRELDSSVDPVKCNICPKLFGGRELYSLFK